MPGAARMTDMMKQDAPHCHAPIHPPAPTPTPVAHPALPLTIVSATAPTVMINSLAAAIVGSISTPCMLPSCVPAGPGMVAMGSSSVMITNMPAGRSGDMTSHSSCVAPIPGPTGTIQSPCSTDVTIGG